MTSTFFTSFSVARLPTHLLLVALGLLAAGFALKMHSVTTRPLIGLTGGLLLLTPVKSR